MRVLPAQIEVVELEALTVGIGTTIRPMVDEVVHEPLLPITVYVVLVAGDTTTLLPVNAPGFHVYVDAPLAVRVALLPTQIDGDEEAGTTVGTGLTVTLTVCVVVHPKALFPVTE